MEIEVARSRREAEAVAAQMEIEVARSRREAEAVAAQMEIEVARSAAVRAAENANHRAARSGPLPPGDVRYSREQGRAGTDQRSYCARLAGGYACKRIMAAYSPVACVEPIRSGRYNSFGATPNAPVLSFS